MLFKNKKKSAAALLKAEEAKRVEMQNALKASEIKLPEKKEFYPYPTEYMKFLEEVKVKPKTWYEKACSFVEFLFPVEPGRKTREKILTNLRAAYINATPRGVFSFAILSTIGWIIFAMFYTLFIVGEVDIFGGFFFGIALINFWFFYTYPSSRAKSLSVQMSSDTVLAILYMVIYMRSSPNLEGAIKFASQNLEGALAWDLRKLLWDIETGKYSSANEALVDYIIKWKDKNKEFSEALNLLKGSAVEQSRREMVYDETIDVILNGTKERAKHYAAGLRMPMTLIYAMGILLPVMGLVLFPIVLIFIADKVKPSFVFFGYDILLPLFLYFIVNQILSSKPPTFSPPDISKAKGVPPMGKFSFGGVNVPIWPIALLVALPFISIGLPGIISESELSINLSLLLIFGLSLIIVTYTFLDSYQKIKTRNDIERIENEFESAMFQLGNIIVSGIPLELAIDKVRDNLRELKISEMFEIISLNMKKFGYTFEEALFDKEVGAIWYYPSKLIQSIMQTIIQSSKKSVKSAANSMIVISRYLRGVHDVKEEIEDILGETTTSMRFLATVLSPLISGVTITMAVIILQILEKLGAAMTSLMGNADTTVAQTFFLIPWAGAGGGKLPITPSLFQLIVGIYMIETAVLISIFLSGVKYGEDAVGLRQLIWNTLLIGVLIYIITWFVTYSMFGGALEGLLSPTGIG